MPVYTVKTSIDISTDFYNGRKLARLSDGKLWCCYTYLNNATGRYEIRCSYSADEGITWGGEEIISTHPTINHFGPALAVDSLDNLHIVYEYRDNLGPLPHFFRIYYRKRTTSWQPEELVDADGSDAAIAIDSSDNIHIVCESYHPVALAMNIRYRQKTSAGVWLPSVWISEQPTAWWGQYFAAIAIDSADDIHVAWEGTDWGANPDKYNIQYRRTLAGVWQAREPITDSPIGGWHPSIAIDSADNVHLAWAYEGKYRMRTAVGWGAEEVIGFTDPVELNIALDQSDTPYVVAENWIAGVTQLYYSRRVAGVWTAEIAITITPTDDYIPILIWANYPTVGGVKTNIPLSGLAVLFWSDTVPRECNYSPILLTWPAPPPVIPFRINRAYALSRHEL